MDEWVLNALKRWPNVPALFGWLGLDRRGRWLIQGETISHPRIIATINRNYAADAQGRWYFQNGPQRGYMQLESTPLILFVGEDQQSLITHTGHRAQHITAAYMDEEGALVLSTEHGPGELIGADLAWALERMSHHGSPVDDDALSVALTVALAAPSQSDTDITLLLASSAIPLRRLNFADTPSVLAFVRQPAPRGSEKTATKVID